MTPFVPLAATDAATNTQALSYSARRALLARDPNAPALSGATARLPLTIQVAFRRKVFAIFATQLLLVALSVTLVAHIPSLHDAWATALDDTPGLIAIPAIATLVLLGVMYKLCTVHPWNWLSLVLFTLALCCVYSGVDILIDTHACLLYSVAVFVWSLLVTALSGVTRRSASDKSAATLLSPVVSGILALVVVVAGEVALFALVKDDALVTTAGLIGSLAFQIVTTVWFALDAAKMFQVLTPDEYMLGVTYFYTDMATLLVVVVIGGAFGGGAGAVMTITEAGVATEDDQV